MLLILPLLFSVTLFANAPGLLSTLILVPTLLLLSLPRRETGTYLPSALLHSRQSSRISNPSRDSSPSRALATPIPPLPALTTYRAHMLLLTFICILAVDFPVFPRSLAKCETFGVSLVNITTYCLFSVPDTGSDGYRCRLLRLLARHSFRDTPREEPCVLDVTASAQGVYRLTEMLPCATTWTVEDDFCQGNRVSSEYSMSIYARDALSISYRNT